MTFKALSESRLIENCIARAVPFQILQTSDARLVSRGLEGVGGKEKQKQQ